MNMNLALGIRLEKKSFFFFREKYCFVNCVVILMLSYFVIDTYFIIPVVKVIFKIISKVLD